MVNQFDYIILKSAGLTTVDVFFGTKTNHMCHVPWVYIAVGYPLMVIFLQIS